ncbi:MAG: DNA polymerase, partial [Pseudorhodobacter sp.]|nr:DNA polymerase [Pseudorhodobacter sp.]
KMLLQVHDELLFDVAEDAAPELTRRAKAVMEGAHHPVLTLKVPLTVESGQGANWAAAH